MARLSGTVDGQRVGDLRVYHMTPGMIQWYKSQGLYDSIIKVGTYGDGHTVSVRVRKPSGTVYKHTWRFKVPAGGSQRQRKWLLDREEFYGH